MLGWEADAALLPAVRTAPDRSVVLADGLSCRTQLDHLAGRHRPGDSPGANRPA